jgi:hypothetical protein
MITSVLPDSEPKYSRTDGCVLNGNRRSGDGYSCRSTPLPTLTASCEVRWRPFEYRIGTVMVVTVVVISIRISSVNGDYSALDISVLAVGTV